MIMKRLDDRELVSLYINGNEKAFEHLLMRHKDKIFRFIYLKVKDRALTDDLFQETFVKVINTLKMGAYNEEGKFLPWAMRIAHNLVIDHFRRTSKVRMISESSSQRDDFNIFSILSSDEKTVEQKWTYEELENQMVELIEYLPESQKGILKSRDRITTEKTRVIGNNHQLLRIDEEIDEDITAAETQQLITLISYIIQHDKIDVILFEDYIKA